MATTNLGSTASEVYGTSSPVSASAPSLTDGTDGQPLNGLSAITITVAAASTRTLSGAGTLDCYILDPQGANIWCRLPSADFAVTATTRAQSFVAQVVVPRNGFVKWIPTSVTFSAGTAGVTVYQAGQVPGVYKGV